MPGNSDHSGLSAYELAAKIEHNRWQMVEIASIKGMQHQAVIKESQILDELLNDYYR
ncbi:MAG: aspartyl-phosphate phosphatase Spo0E family protein [Methanomassiliicoccales archaeon]